MPKFLRVLGVLLLVLSVLSFVLVSYARDFSVLISGMLSFGLLFAAAEVLESLRAIKSAVCAPPASAHNASASSAKVIGKKCLICGRHFPATVDRCPDCNADMFQKIYDEKN